MPRISSEILGELVGDAGRGGDGVGPSGGEPKRGGPPPGMRCTSFWCDADLWRQLKFYAVDHDMTMGQLLNEALGEFWDRHSTPEPAGAAGRDG